MQFECKSGKGTTSHRSEHVDPPECFPRVWLLFCLCLEKHHSGHILCRVDASTKFISHARAGKPGKGDYGVVESPVVRRCLASCFGNEIDEDEEETGDSGANKGLSKPFVKIAHALVAYRAQRRNPR